LEQMNIAQGITYTVLSRVVAPKTAALIALGKASDYSINFSSSQLLRSYLAEYGQGVVGSIEVLSVHFGISPNVVVQLITNFLVEGAVAVRLPEACHIYLNLPRQEVAVDHIALAAAAAFDASEAAALMARISHTGRVRTVRYDLLALPGTRLVSTSTLNMGSDELVHRLQLDTNVLEGTFHAGGAPFGVRAARSGLIDAQFAGTFIGQASGGTLQTRGCLGALLQDGLQNSSLSLTVGGRRFKTFISGHYMMLIPDGPYFCVLLFELPVIGLSRVSGVLSPVMAGPLSYMVQYLASAGRATLGGSKAAIRQWVSSYHQPAWTVIDVSNWLAQLYLAAKHQQVAMDGIIGHYTGQVSNVNAEVYGQWEDELKTISLRVKVSTLLDAYCVTLAMYLHLITYGRLPMPEDDARERLGPDDPLLNDLDRLIFMNDPVATYATGMPTPMLESLQQLHDLCEHFLAPCQTQDSRKHVALKE